MCEYIINFKNACMFGIKYYSLTNEIDAVITNVRR